MTKRKRITLFIVFAFLFLILAPFLIFYALGYSFDLQKGKFVKTGAFYFKTNLKDYQVLVNGKFRGKSSFILGTVFIKNIIPREYKITIERDGFYPWEKNLQVKEGLTTEARHITLFPKDIHFTPLLSKNVGKFYFGWGKIFFIQGDEENWILGESSLEGEEKKVILTKKEIKGDFSISKIIFSSDGKTMLLTLKNSSQKKLFLLREDIPQKKIQEIFLPKEAKLINFSPLGDNSLFFLEKEKLRKWSLQAGYENILDSVVTYSFWNNKIVWLDNNGFLYESDISGKPLAVLNFSPFPIKKNKEYQIYLGNNLSKIILQEDSTFFYLDNNQFKKILEGGEKLNISPDVKKIAFFSNHEIKIFFWEDLLDQPQRKRGETILLFRFLENIGKVRWINGDYIIFSLGDKIKISEIDNRDHINVIDIGNFQNPDFEYDGSSKKAFVLSDGTLYLSSQITK